MSKKFVLAFYLVTAIYQTQNVVIAAPYGHDDQNAIIVIPFKSTDEQITKINSFKIDGDTAVKQLTSRVSAEKILRTLSNVQEFGILVEGLDAITLGDVYKAAFPNGILQTIGEQYLHSPIRLENHKTVNTKPVNIESIKHEAPSDDKEVDIGTDNDQYDEVSEDDDAQISDAGLKEEPITDDYVYDQPVEDRFVGEREYVTRQTGEVEAEDNRDSKNLNPPLTSLNEDIINEELKNKELSKYGAKFRSWITEFLAG